MAQYTSPSVYVGNLDPQVEEQQLFDHFKVVGSIVSVRVCLDSQTQKSLCYGYVNFQNAADADSAIQKLDATKLKGKHIRVQRVQRDPSQRRSGKNNVIVKHLPANMDTVQLKDLFSKYGKITSTSIATNADNVSRGYAYVMFESEDAATKGVEALDGSEIEEGIKLKVEHYNPQHRQQQLQKFTNLYVKNVSKVIDNATFEAYFATFGTVSSSKIRLDPTGKSMGFGYVAFEQHEEAEKAVKDANGQVNDISDVNNNGEKQPLVVARFQGHSERERNRQRRRKEMQAQFAKYPNLYVKHFDDGVSSDRLKELFEGVGPTMSVKVMIDPITKVSRCFGFVSVRDQPTAQKCIQELNGSTFLGIRPLFVTYALKKDARRQALEEQHRKMRMQPPVQQNRPVMGGMNPMQNPMFSHMGMMGAMGGLNRGGGGGMMPNQMGGNRMLPQGPMQRMGMPQTMDRRPMQQPQPITRVAPQPPPQQPQQQQSLAAMLASMNQDQQKNVLGERLYTYIIRENPSSAAKVTGMLLEMDNGEILNLLDSPELLDSKISEALDVLQRHSNI